MKTGNSRLVILMISLLVLATAPLGFTVVETSKRCTGSPKFPMIFEDGEDYKIDSCKDIEAKSQNVHNSVTKENKTAVHSCMSIRNEDQTENLIDYEFIGGRGCDSSLSNGSGSLISSLSELLKDVVHNENNSIFGFSQKDYFGFRTVKTTQRPSKSKLRGKCVKRRLILKEKSDKGIILRNLNATTSKTLTEDADSSIRSSCTRGGNNIFIFLNRNYSPGAGSKGVIDQDDFEKPEERATITTVLPIEGEPLQISPEKSITGLLSKSRSGSNKDLTQYADATESSIESFANKEYQKTDILDAVNPPLVKQICRKLPSIPNSYSLPSIGKILKSIDIDLKCKQEHSVTGSIKLNYM